MNPVAPEILTKIYKYCAYQDRCKWEVKKKLRALDTPEAQIETIVQHLEEERFIDETRYIESFVRGKFFQKKWGKIKIRHALQAKHVDRETVEQMMQKEISFEVYQQTLQKLILQKKQQWAKLPPWDQKAKGLRSLQQRGFETSLILDLWEQTAPED